MQDLNDLYYFAKVVEHGGFAPAGRALGEPKSKLSRRIALLEERQAVRKAKNFQRADEIRDALKQMGYAVEDTANGPKLKKL